MSKIQDFLKSLLTAKLGRDVRQGIHDSIEQCYKDATGHPESVAAVVKDNEDIKKLVEETPYCECTEDEAMELPIHTINDDIVSDSSTWSSQKIDNKGFAKASDVYSKEDIDALDFLKKGNLIKINLPKKDWDDVTGSTWSFKLPDNLNKDDVILLGSYSDLYVSPVSDPNYSHRYYNSGAMEFNNGRLIFNFVGEIRDATCKATSTIILLNIKNLTVTTWIEDSIKKN